METALEELVRKQFVAEEAVRIVHRFNDKKSKKPRNERLVDLCTDIARILDVNKKLETTIKSQEAELNTLRSSGEINHTQDSALDPSAQTPESPPPQGLVRSPSSGRGTAYTLRETGTDPVFDWTERPETLSRATSPIQLNSTSRATSPWKQYTSSRATSPLQSKDNFEGLSTDMSELHETRDMDTEPDETDKADEYQDDFQSDIDTANSNAENEEPTDEIVTKKESGFEDTVDEHEDIEEAGTPNKDRQKENKQEKHTSKEKPSNRAGTKESGSLREKDRSKRTSRASDTKGTKRDVKEKPNRNTRTQEIKIKNTERNKSVSSATSSTRRKLAEERDNKEASKRRSAHASGRPEKRSTQSSDKKTNRHVYNKEEEKEDRKTTERKDAKDVDKQTRPKSRPKKFKSPNNSARKRLSKTTTHREGSGKSVHWYSSDESSSSSSSESEVDEEHTRKLRPELSAEYWDIHKLVKFLRVGNPTVTVIALCTLQEFNLEQEMTQVSIIDLDGISILLNLLKTDHRPCMIGSLKILRRLSISRRVNNEIYRLGGIQQLIKCLNNKSIEIQSLAAGTISNFVSFRKAYNAIKKYNGIPRLVKLLQPNKNPKPLRYRAYTNTENASTLLHNACNALWSCSKSEKNIEAIRNAGVVPILASLLRKGPSDVILSTVGIIQECSSDASFREEIRKEGIIEDVVGFLREGENELRTLCANAIFKCGDDEETQKLVQKHRGLDPLIQVVASTDNNQDKKLLGAVVGAIWKCASNKENLTRLEKFDTLYHLIRHLKMKQPHEVEANIIGALGEFAYNRRNVLTLYEEGVLNIIINRLNLTMPNILINSSKLLALCAKENAPRQAILTSDGVRLLWSLLKSSNHKVVASACYGIAMCVSDAKESAEIVRSFVGGLELVTNLLRSNKREVLINTCRLVINIGQDRENMSIMTDYDAVPLLISLVYADDEEMRQYVAEAIATCCNLDKNITALSSTVVPLSEGFALYKGVEVHRTTALALEKLSQDPHNCYLIHRHGALKHLMKMIGSEDDDVQEAAARCIKNVRMNAIDQNS
ncbi:armadillo repeat-containing protein 4-like [Actinia tenebrosa]|uniref:Armadillo repeat-containing protein 4-like n=1 Tax=Actinia tenebrosa TaxID=6105 RepID=A0A6P8IZW3_ACTTE|nr:armadillo repeat-containing protein 4-like [Actinia tenebrosa]